MKIKPLPSQEVLLSLLRYDPETGKLYWRPRLPDPKVKSPLRAIALANLFNKRSAGKEAFTSLSKGRPAGTIYSIHYYAHRIIWKMLHGVDPDQIDHEEGIRHDNREAKMRSVGNMENCRNKRLSKNNTSGYAGVSYSKRIGKWQAKIKVNYRSVHIGYFDEIELAAGARRKAEKKYGFHENHGKMRLEEVA